MSNLAAVPNSGFKHSLADFPSSLQCEKSGVIATGHIFPLSKQREGDKYEKVLLPTDPLEFSSTCAT